MRHDALYYQSYLHTFRPHFISRMIGTSISLMTANHHFIVTAAYRSLPLSHARYRGAMMTCAMTNVSCRPERHPRAYNAGLAP
jgi:hypothetical protein